MKFRIIKRETTKGTGESENQFLIQKKFLFWWFNYKFKIHYSTYRYKVGDFRIPFNNIPNEMARITKRVFSFNSEVKAKRFLNKIKKPFYEKYKGNRIGIVFDENTLEDVYVNWSYSGPCISGYGYEFSKSLYRLKEMIDKRDVKTKVSIVNL